MNQQNDQINNVIRVNFSTKKPEEKPVCLAKNDKQQAFEKTILQGKVLVIFDTELANVPIFLKKNKQLALNFSTNFGWKDFAYDNVGVRSSLTFEEGVFFCDVPWESVLAIGPGESDDCIWFLH